MAGVTDRDTPPWMNPAHDDKDDFKLGGDATVENTEPHWMRDSGDDDDDGRPDERSPLVSAGAAPGHLDRDSSISLIGALLLSFLGVFCSVVAPCTARPGSTVAHARAELLALSLGCAAALLFCRYHRVWARRFALVCPLLAALSAVVAAEGVPQVWREHCARDSATDIALCLLWCRVWYALDPPPPTARYRFRL